MTLHCIHGQEHMHVPSSLGVTQPQGKEQIDSSAGSVQGSVALCRVGTVLCQDGQTAQWVLAGITTSSRQQELGWAGHYVAEPAQD